MDAQTTRIDRHIVRRASPPPDRLIPATIHQTFKTVDIPERMHAAAMSWVERNPGFDYRFHDNDACRSFIAEHFAPEVLSAYDKLDYGAFKADLWRYCLLWVEGGIYADIDTLCQTDLTHVIGPRDAFIVPSTGNLPAAVFNAFICAVPGHPFLRAAIDRAVGLIHESETVDGYMTTGPGNLGAAMNLTLGRGEGAPHEVGSHAHDGQDYRILRKNRGTEGDRNVSDGDRVVFLTKYEGYLDDLSEAGVDHWTSGPKASLAIRALRGLAKRFLK